MRPGPWVLLALLLFPACATIPVLPRDVPPAAEVLQQVDARRRALEGLKGLAQTRISSPEKVVSANQVLFARRPGFLRVEALSPFGTPVLYAATDGRGLNLYQPSENRYYEGSFQASSPSLGLPSNLTSEEIVSFLLGGLPRNDYEQVTIRAEREKGLWVLELLAPSREETQMLWVHPRSFYVLRAEFHRPHLSYHAEFTDFHPAKEIPFPRRMLLDLGNIRTRISVEFLELELNPSWEPQDFLIPVPPGAAVVPWP